MKKVVKVSQDFKEFRYDNVRKRLQNLSRHCIIQTQFSNYLLLYVIVYF